MDSPPPWVVFVLPFFAETSMRFLSGILRLPGVRVGLISQDPASRLPPQLRERLAAHRRIADGLEASQITAAVRELSGGQAVHRLLGALEQLQVPLAEVRQALGIAGMGIEAARNFRDKSRMKQRLAQAGVPCARHALARGIDDARRQAREVGFPLVAKPPAGAAARHTCRLEAPQELEEYLRALPPTPAEPLLLEEFVVGQEHSFDTVSIGGRPVWHSLTHYQPGPLEVLRQPWIQWTVLLPREIDHPYYDDIRRVGFRALEVLGMTTGLSHMEWFRRPDARVAVSEVGARPPGAQFTTLMSYAHDFDFYAAWGRLMVFDRFDPPPRRFAAGIAYLRGQGRGVVRGVRGLDRAQREIGRLVVEVRLPRPGQRPTSGYEGEGFVVVRHPQTETVRQALRRIVSLVRVDLG